jgi:hypothetical protein
MEEPPSPPPPSKRKSRTKPVEPIAEPVIQSIAEPITEQSQSLLKPKRVKSEAQQAVWKKAQETRLANAKLKKDALAKAKEEIENKKKPKPDLPITEPIPKPPLAKKEPKIIYENDSDDEPDVVIVKKKKKKKIIYEESSSDEELPTRGHPSAPRVKQPQPIQQPIIRLPIVRFF